MALVQSYTSAVQATCTAKHILHLNSLQQLIFDFKLCIKPIRQEINYLEKWLSYTEEEIQWAAVGEGVGRGDRNERGMPELTCKELGRN